MSLRITPLPSNPSYTTPERGAPSAPGVHDTLRHNLSLTSSTASTGIQQPASLTSAHPLEARLANWRATQDALKMEGLRRVHGLGEPLRRGMELKIARDGEWMPRMLGGGSGVHVDVLAGRDCEIGWEDVFKGDEMRDLPDFHSEMEARLRMNW
ncbi:proteasome maturation factor UMP1 [Rhizodiscina lignyota]|uniref:Proteasome maturation factor UMP1 n=1 Tax=Rhizodiscina lignyota TaxID=1504668 RepID=A0A9P4I9C2_9PEZI|nr:proteasome maturation factor UMP1 [Rhizodiscina lignyota]